MANSQIKLILSGGANVLVSPDSIHGEATLPGNRVAQTILSAFSGSVIQFAIADCVDLFSRFCFRVFRVFSGKCSWKQSPLRLVSNHISLREANIKISGNKFEAGLGTQSQIQNRYF